ncbi:MAG: hypothetical protein SynsKO_09180 [Synoicihabitans sp.]
MNLPPQRLPRFALTFISVGIMGILMGGCMSPTSHIPLGTPIVRTPTSPHAVRIYNTPPSAYEEVAIIDTSSINSVSLTEQSHQDKAIERLKEEAARLGANGIILQTLTRPAIGHVGHTGHTTTGSSTASHPPSGAIVVPSSAGIGIGSGHGHLIPGATIPYATASGIAIYVPTNSSAVSLLEKQQLEQLQTLKELRDEGIISNSDYEKRRAAIVESMAVAKSR